jgi:hypothetical protein
VSVTCAGCQRTIQVPPDKAALPNLKVKCRCGNVFAVASALAAALGAPPPANAPAYTTVPPVPVVPPLPAPRVPMAAASSAAVAVPVPVRPATPTAPPPVSARPAVPRAAAASGSTVASNWRKCANHPQERAGSICPKCVKGYCPACVQVVQGGAICGQCDGLCVSFAQYEDVVQMERQRARPLMDDLGLIITYPLRDRVGFVLLALFTWFFGLFAGMAPIAFLLSQGVLLWYMFFALARVASGNLKDFMPDMRDIGDLVQPARLAFAAFLISSGPMILVTIFFAAATLPLGIGTTTGPSPQATIVFAQAQEQAPAGEDAEPADDKSEEGGRAAGSYEDDFPREKPGLLGPIILLVAVAWKILYTPVALVVAALSRSFLSTINPVIGIWAIGKMGAVYWQCLGIYCVLAGSQWILGLLLGFIPVAGGFVAAFINAYASLAIACTLGLGVYKKAPELDWD